MIMSVETQPTMLKYLFRTVGVKVFTGAIVIVHHADFDEAACSNDTVPHHDGARLVIRARHLSLGEETTRLEYSPPRHQERPIYLLCL